MRESWGHAREHELGGGFAPLNFSSWVFQGRQRWTRSAWLSVLTNGCLAELDLLPIREAVGIDVGNTHGMRLERMYCLVDICLRCAAMDSLWSQYARMSLYVRGGC